VGEDGDVVSCQVEGVELPGDQ